MLSLRLRFEDQLAGSEPASPQRWLRGAALSLAVHVVAIAAIVVHARQNAARWEPGPSVVDLARTDDSRAAGEGVTVGLADQPLPTSMLAAPALDDELSNVLTNLPTLPTSAPAAPRSPPHPARSRTAIGGVPGRAGGSTRLASRDSTGAAAAITSLGLPLPGADPVPGMDPAHAAFRAQLRRHLHDAWHANEVFARIDPKGQLDGSLFATGIQVRLRADGRIEKADLAESSGIAALDKEALGGLARMEPLPPLPSSMVDAQGGWTVLCKFFLDVGMFRFAAEIRQAIADKWHPSRAFGVTADQERKTVVRFVLDRDGTLVSANVIASAGLDFLDANALAVAQPGMRLPAPPAAFMRQPGPANVFVAFLHQARDVRVLRPREDVEEQ